MNSKKYDGTETRLAASDVNSLVGSQIMNDDATHEAIVKKRLARNLRVSPDEMEEAYQRLADRIKDAELTINFNPEKLFQTRPQEQVQNVFERPRSSDYMANRQKVEEEMFRYSSLGQIFNAEEITNRIATLGDYNYSNPYFDPNIRPRYGALNIFNMKTGGAGSSTYGDSHFVLKDYVKHRCTFTYNDSFKLADKTRVSHLANIIHPARILRDMTDFTLSMLYSRSKNNIPRRNDLLGHCYIEAQIHTEILFNRDVKKSGFAIMKLTEAMTT